MRMETRNLKECWMSEEENVGVVEQEVVQQEVASPSETVSEHNEPTEAMPQRPKRKDVEYNWAQARRQREELMQQNQIYQEEIMRLRQQNQPQTYEDPLDKLADDDIVTKKQAILLAERRAEEKAKKVVEDYVRQREMSTVDQRIKSSMPDFEEVVTEEAIEFLRTQRPSLAKALHSLKDEPYDQAQAIYDSVKAYVPKKSAQQVLEKKKAIENSQKPVSVQAIPKQSVLGTAAAFDGRLTPELRKQYIKEMEEAIKGY